MLLYQFDAGKLENSPDCISAYNQDLMILIWNSACEKKYGIAKQEALGRNLLHLFPHIEDDYRVRCFRKSIQQEQSFFFPNLPYLYGKGLYTQVILPLRNAEQQVIGSLNVVRDGEYRRIKKEDLLNPLQD